MLLPTLGPNSLPVVVAQPDERHANRAASVLEWYVRHRAYIVQHLAQTKKKKKYAVYSQPPAENCQKSSHPMTQQREEGGS